MYTRISLLCFLTHVRRLQNHRSIDVQVFKPKDAKELESKYKHELASCDVIHVLESEQFLPEHNYRWCVPLLAPLPPLPPTHTATHMYTPSLVRAAHTCMHIQEHGLLNQFDMI